MMNSNSQRSILSDFEYLEAIGEEVFTRARSAHADVECLQIIAFELFYGKKKAESDLKSNVRELDKLVEMIALVVGKTYVERGDSFDLADDEALTLIRDLLLKYNPCVVARNKDKRLPKHLFL